MVTGHSGVIIFSSSKAEGTNSNSGHGTNGRKCQLRGRWCRIVLNVHAPTADIIYDVNGSFYEELDRVFDQF
jgi:hypothetical protein